MTKMLTPTRFAELADAYGGAIARWPEDVRTAAMALAAQPAMRAILADAGRLDAQLDRWRVALPAPVLRDLRGGRVVSDWPGLGPSALYEGRDLRPTASMDEVIAGVAGASLGLDPAHVARTLFGSAASMNGLVVE